MSDKQMAQSRPTPLAGTPAPVSHGTIDQSIARARDGLLALQQPDGHWCFDFETDCTISAEYILMMHYLGDIDEVMQEKLARYIRGKQVRDGHGGWPLYHDGALDISCSVKSYFALKAAGDAEDAPHMAQARQAIVDAGGAAAANVFTRILLALFEQVPWEAVPYVPVEIMLFPRWFPFNLDKVSYWARTTMVPLFILCAKRASARNPKGVSVRELFLRPPETETQWFASDTPVDRLFIALDQLGRRVDPFIPARLRQHAIDKAVAWFSERLNGRDGLGAIFPPMVNALMAMDLLGYADDHPDKRVCRQAIDDLIVQRDDGTAFCQPCVSPVWDTGWSAMALLKAGGDEAREGVDRALDWLAARQELELKGDWAVNAPDVAPGGWAFQYTNPYYPDLDDTAMVAGLMHVADGTGAYTEAVNRAADWLTGLQSSNGGFAAFDIDNNKEYINHIPFADHGAMLDPPTEDVTGRVLACLGVLARSGREGRRDRKAIARAVRYLKRAQQPDGSWWGRWGSNYIYGTWSAMAGLALVGEDLSRPYMRKALRWIQSRQNPDGGWGETNDTYLDPRLAGTDDGVSSPEVTAWALLAHFAVGEDDCEAVRRGIAWLCARQQEDGLWSHPRFNAPGFPRVFYLKYHGYSAYFPLWALTRYRSLQQRRQAGA